MDLNILKSPEINKCLHNFWKISIELLQINHGLAKVNKRKAQIIETNIYEPGKCRISKICANDPPKNIKF